METLEEIVLKLNEMLNITPFSTVQFEKLFDNLRMKYHPKIGFLDFEYFNETTLKKAQKEKIKAVKTQNFEYAATRRVLEKECLKYIELRTRFEITKSIFLCEDNHFVYSYFGTARNDKRIKKFFKVQG
jgi:hypothetical protein